jgi:hypothetical protein
LPIPKKEGTPVLTLEKNNEIRRIEICVQNLVSLKTDQSWNDHGRFTGNFCTELSTDPVENREKPRAPGWL